MKKQLRSKLVIYRESLRRLEFPVTGGSIQGPTATTCGTIECVSETGVCTGAVCNSVVTC